MTGLTSALAAKADTGNLSPVALSGNYTDLTGRPTISGANTGDQSLSVSGTNLTISGGNTVVLPGGVGSASWGTISGTVSDQADLQTALNLKAPLASPTFTGTPTGITKAHVGLTNVDNTSDANKPVSSATQTALDAKVASSDFDTILKMTDAAYTALATKDQRTLYVIVG